MLLTYLQEEVWIDTVVLANYEFFSSMIRTFRVSISDRYPVKMEKWKDIGTYEARNSREIQAFLIENPQIWGRYLRIEFLTHYGNEYYCPLSLVRVHGARMLESLKEGDGNNEEEEEEDGEDPVEPTVNAQAVVETENAALLDEKLQAELKEAKAAIDDLLKEAEEITAALSTHSVETDRLSDISSSLQTIVHEQLTTPWVPGFDFGAWMNASQGLDVCLPREAPSVTPIEPSTAFETVGIITSDTRSVPISRESLANSTTAVITTPTIDVSTPSTISPIVPESYATQPSTSVETSQSIITATMPQNSTSAISSMSSTSASVLSSAAKLQNATSSIKSRMSATSSAAVTAPTQQESFFKAVSRRLQLLEANSTLSLKYIEEQSKALREAFSRVEKRQLNKTTTFLNALNSTVLTELKEIRQQYDEIWQSTIISLESQRAESRKEILALSSRLNILADEVVFQKRMSIVQSVLLLLCLGLVIFSRVSPGLPMNFSNRSRYPTTYGVESPLLSQPGSPDYGVLEGSPEPRDDRTQLSPDDRVYATDNDDIIYEEGEEASQDEVGRSDEDENSFSRTPRSPPTPTSLYSDSSSIEATPPNERVSTPIIFERMPQLQRAASSSYSLHLNHEKDLQNGHSVLRPHLFAKSNSSDSIPSIRQRAKADMSRLSEVQTPPKDSPQRHYFDRNTSEEKPLPDIRQSMHEEQTRIPGSSRDRRHTENYLSSPAMSDGSFATDGSLPPPYTNGHSHDDLSSPASRQGLQRTSSSPSNRIGRDRQHSTGSFGIARKPLPALPNDNDEDETYNEKDV